MGQSTGCCEKNDMDSDLLITMKKMNELSQGGQLYKNPLYQSRLLHSNKLHELFRCKKVGMPTLNQHVNTTLANQSSFKIPQHCERGLHQPEFYQFQNTGIVYSGEWKDHVPHGLGKNYYPNQSYYQGIFVQGVPHGYGRFINANGDSYEGDIKFGRANGVGVYESRFATYRGDFKDNQKHGKGIEKTTNSFYQGTFQYDEKVQGILKYGSSSYEGTFQDNTFNGKGKLTNDKGVYIGSFKDGLQDGYGQFSWKDGSIYRGYFKAGVKEGEGEFYNSANESIARGLWKNGYLNGNGQYLEPSGVKHKCIWQKNKIKALIQ